MKNLVAAFASKGDALLAIFRAILVELGRLNRFAVDAAPLARRREQSQMVARAFERRYRGPHRCC